MGGHGGLNILPQKRWNVYNFENREKVRKDEEEAAREEQLKQEQSRRRDAEFRLERLRQARGLASSSSSSAAAAAAAATSPPPSSDSHHINLFEGLQDFPSLAEPDLPTAAADGAQRGGGRKNPTRDEGSGRDPKRKREDRPVVISPEDEKYRMGYGVAGKGVKAPWYLSRPTLRDAADGSDDGRDPSRGRVGDSSKKEAGGKRTIDELREERLKRERREKERERAVLVSARRERRGIGWNGCERKLR